MDFGLLLRWSIRDIRERKFQVIAIALLIGLGTGSFVGLTSSTPWRQKAFDKSYDLLKMYDLKVESLPGSFVNRSELASILSNVPHAHWIKAIEYRLIFPTMINASYGEKVVLSSGRIIGINVSSGSANLQVNGIEITAGRHIRASENDADVGIIEYNFAKYYDLQPKGQNITIAGGKKLSYVGTALAPEYLMVNEGSVMMAQASFCAIFVPLETALKILQHQNPYVSDGFVNEALIRVSSDADQSVLQTEIENAIDTVLGVGTVITDKNENPTYSLLKDDIINDHSFYLMISVIILIIAAFGTYVLVSRIIRSHRHQIGINMALGVPLIQIVLRYLLFIFLIALGGCIFGLPIAYILGSAIGDLIEDVVRFPVYEEWFVIESFLQGMALGIIIPIIAAIIPIWQVTRTKPVDALRSTQTMVPKTSGSVLLSRIELPGSVFFNFPIKNLTRNIQRTISSIITIALAISLMVLVLSLSDGYYSLLRTEGDIILGDSPERTDVTLNGFYNSSKSPVTNITGSSLVKKSVVGIEIPANLFHSDTSFSIILRFFDLSNDLWSPELKKGSKSPVSSLPGIVLSNKAADDLEVDVGGSITVEHFYLENELEFSQKNTTFEVIGITTSEIRFWSFVDISDSSVMNCSGKVNYIMLEPETGVSYEDLQEEFFLIDGYAGTMPAKRLIEAYEDMIGMLTSILNILQIAVLLMAFLLSYNTTILNIDERTRELATMAAFGTPPRTMTRFLIVENMIIGIIGTLIGYFPLGIIFTDYFISGSVKKMMPDIRMTPYLYPQSIALLIAVGVLLVGIIPIFAIRRLSRMDLPSTLRVIE